MPAKRKSLVGNQAIIRRKWKVAEAAYFTVGGAHTVTQDGKLTNWQFHALYSGSGAFMVFRPRTDLGADK